MLSVEHPQAVGSNMETPEDEKKSEVATQDSEDVRSLRSKAKQLRDRVNHFFSRWGIETNGYVVIIEYKDMLIEKVSERIDPIPPAERTDTKLYQMFFVWFSVNMNVLS